MIKVILIIIALLIVYVLINTLAFVFIGGKKFYKIPFTKAIFHDCLEWHYPNEQMFFNGIGFVSRCAICGKLIAEDSQGNWFEIGSDKND